MVTVAIRQAADEWSKLGEDLQRDGFVSLNHVTTIDDIQFIRHELMSLWDDQSERKYQIRNLGEAATETRDGRILEITSPSTFRPSLLESLFVQRILQISRSLLGPSARLKFDHYIVKPPHNTTATDWHQDGAYSHRLIRTPRRLHWWLPLQDVNLENGCMQYIPRSHLGPLLRHQRRSAGSPALRTKLPADVVSVACPLDVGGATIHLLKTLHCTGPNTSDTTRHAWIVQVGVSDWLPTWQR